jgi:hypothetical protein
VRPIKFVRKDFLFLSALRAVAGERFQTLEVGIAGAVLGGGLIRGHGFLLACCLSDVVTDTVF